MPVISGGGGGGNTTAQVAASGKVLPVADATGVIVDTTTYANPVTGVGSLSTLVFPADSGLLAVAQAGDAHPRALLTSDTNGDGWYFGNGTVDPYSAGLQLVFSVANGLALFAAGNMSLKVGQPSTNLGLVTRVNPGPLQLFNGGERAAISSNTGAPVDGGNVGDIYIRTDGANGTLILYRCTVAGTAGNATWVPVLTPGSPVGIVTSGALSTVQLVTATGAQISTSRDAETHTPVTFNPGVATTATVTVALSPDNVTYSTLAVVTKPVGTVFDGEIDDISVRVPAGWYLKLTVNAQAALGLTTWY